MPKSKAEDDVARDPQIAGSRETGGVPDPSAPDQASTTGATPTPEFVGRVTGDEAGTEEESGAERRAHGRTRHVGRHRRD